MSSQGTSGDGQGGGIGDGRGGWASPLGTGLPGPAEIEEVGEGARDEVAARGEGAEGAPHGDGQGGEGERRAQPQPDPGTGGGEGLVAQGVPEGVTGAPPAVAAGASEVFLETPRGREMFQDFLTALARQPGPSEAPDRGDSTATTAASGTAAPITASTARPSLLASENATLTRGVPAGGVPSSVAMVTPMEHVSNVPAHQSGYVPASELGGAWQGPLQRVDMVLPELVPGLGPSGPALGRGVTTVPAGAARGNAGTASVQTTVASTGSGTTGPGTSASNPDLRTFLRDAMNQALRMYANGETTAMGGQPPSTMAPTSLPTTAPQGYVPPAGPVPTPTPVGYATQTGYLPSQLASAVPTYGSAAMTALTPSGVSRAAIPSYGGVSINLPSATGVSGMGTLLPGAFYPPFQPAMVATPTWGPAVGTTTPLPAYGGPTAVTGQPLAPGAYPFGGQGGGYGVPATTSYQASSQPVIGIPNELRNAVKVIVPFQSESASCERAATFWRSFEKCTHGMDDQMRLTAFEQCLKGKLGLEWWYNSRIDSFETLRVRFHNRFICQTPAQLWNRLKNAKRNKGESAEEWGDRISTMCEALNYNEPRMRFEFFLEGLRNKQMRAMLNSSMVTSIPEACALLLYKNLHLPVEEEDEFASESPERNESKASASTQSQMLHQLQMMNQLMLQQQSAGTPPSGQINAVTPATAAVPFSNGNGPLPIRLAPDTRTTEGGVVCGRCVRAGHGRELCPRRNGRCNRCGELGHFSVECNVPKPPGNARSGERRTLTCFLCGGPGHIAMKCPGLDQLRGLMTAAAAGTATPTTQSQQ